MRWGALLFPDKCSPRLHYPTANDPLGIIAVEKVGSSAKHPLFLTPSPKALPLVLRPHSTGPRPTGTPAAAAPQNEGFLREVDEALREQEMVDAFRRYGKLVGAAIIVILIALGAYLWWDRSSKEKVGERGEQLTMALDQLEAGRLDAARSQLATLAESGTDGSQAAARLAEAGVLVEQNKLADAQKLFGQVASDGDAPQPYRDLATIREVALGFDAMPADQVVARLKPLAVPGKPWFGSAGELLGIAYMKQGQNQLAGPLFKAVSQDKTVPDSLRRRTRQLAGLLGVDAIDDVNEAANSGAQAAAAAAAPAAPAAPAPAASGAAQ